jgi:hypothetical protein
LWSDKETAQLKVTVALSDFCLITTSCGAVYSDRGSGGGGGTANFEVRFCSKNYVVQRLDLTVVAEGFLLLGS